MMKPIYQNLYQFSTYIPPMDFTIHQYLLVSDPAILFASGTMQQAESILPQVKELLAGKKLDYLFVSHMESDECGGISAFLREFPDMKAICSGMTARELPGYGYTGGILPVSPEKPLEDGGLSLCFFNYPSEVHLQNGIVCLEKNSGIFYSADLMLRFGNGVGSSVKGRWADEVSAIGEERVPCEARLEKLKKELLTVSPAFLAVGHGFCVVCE